MDWFVAALKKYAVFKGRARRKEYWFFMLFYILIYIGLAFVEMMLGGRGQSGQSGQGGFLTALYSLFMLLPSLAVGVRRLHDTGRTGWWLLIGFVPIAGALVLIWFTVKDSEPGTNRFGPNPKLTNDPDFDNHEWGSIR